MDLSVLEFQKNYLQNYFFEKFIKNRWKSWNFWAYLEKRPSGVIFFNWYACQLPNIKVKHVKSMFISNFISHMPAGETVYF